MDSLYDEFGNYIGPELSDSDQVGSGLWRCRALLVRAAAAAPARAPPEPRQPGARGAAAMDEP